MSPLTPLLVRLEREMAGRERFWQEPTPIEESVHDFTLENVRIL